MDYIHGQHKPCFDRMGSETSKKDGLLFDLQELFYPLIM